MFLAPAGYLQDWPRPRGGQAQAYWWRAGGHTGHLSLQVDRSMDNWIFWDTSYDSIADYSLWTTCPKYGTCIIYSVYVLFLFAVHLELCAGHLSPTLHLADGHLETSVKSWFGSRSHFLFWCGSRSHFLCWCGSRSHFLFWCGSRSHFLFWCG